MSQGQDTQLCDSLSSSQMSTEPHFGCVTWATKVGAASHPPTQAAATKSTAAAPKYPDRAVMELFDLVLMSLLGSLGVVGLSVCLSQTERTPETLW